MATDRTLIGLQLFKALVKDGCAWQGDILDRTWSELLYYTPDNKDRVLQTLAEYEEGFSWKRHSEFAVLVY